MAKSNLTHSVSSDPSGGIHPVGKDGLVMDREYWRALYGDGYSIDGHFNAKEHARYIKTLFQLVDYSVKSLGDFGFGKGILLREFQKAFRPARIVAVEPSEDRVDELRNQKWVTTTHIQIHHSTLEDFQPKYLGYAPMDLGICNSVLQYVPDKKLEGVVEKLSRYNRFLYVAVPTKEDYKRMKRDLGFEDPYAHQRTLKLYRKIFSRYFRFVSFNLLESRFLMETSPFEAELFVF